MSDMKLEDVSTLELAALFVQVFRQNSTDDTILQTHNIVGRHVFESPDAKKLMQISALQNYVKFKTSGPGQNYRDMIDITIANILTGVIIGFKYAEYLHEQQALKELVIKYKMPLIDNWAVNKHIDGEFIGQYYLHGNIFRHPNPLVINGEPCSTSPLLYIDFKNKIATTKNTTYHLGDPSI